MSINNLHNTNKKAMLCQPMAGKTDEEIVMTREKAIDALTSKGFSVVNTLFSEEMHHPLRCLSKALEIMSDCHTVYFCSGWESARGCKIEHAAALAYGLEIIYEASALIDDVARIKY